MSAFVVRSLVRSFVRSSSPALPACLGDAFLAAKHRVWLSNRPRPHEW
jgi:hypothetical protein